MGREVILSTFLPCIPNLQSSSCNHSSKNVPSIHAFFRDRYLQGRLRRCLEVTKHFGLADFPTTDISIFSTRALDASNRVHRTLLCFPPEQRLPRKCKDFVGSASSDQISLHQKYPLIGIWLILLVRLSQCFSFRSLSFQ